jgi:hypothetical protein
MPTSTPGREGTTNRVRSSGAGAHLPCNLHDLSEKAGVGPTAKELGFDLAADPMAPASCAVYSGPALDTPGR